MGTSRHDPAGTAGTLPLATAAGYAIFLDIDGTLLELAPTPDAVEVSAALLDLLRALAARVDGAIAFVSGRPIRGIDALFRPLVFPAVGVHGAEIRSGDGRLLEDRLLDEALQAVVPALRSSLARLAGTEMENKGSAIALHYRSAPQLGREVLRAAEIAVAQLGSQFGVLRGKCVVEIRPRHATKGAAIERLLQEPPFRGRVPIFAGDDVTDEDGFELVNRLRGISIHIGDSASTVATYRLGTPQMLLQWLQQVAAQQGP
ncbi:MAG TPA: trehalose-phosphatase [Steroidobacteraceae bacterium]|nr:trehalose-phosphatase [Steroidobacteraceae bacterium]